MSGTRTFVIGDIHGDLGALDALLARLPDLSTEDAVVFLGDYVDRGPDSCGVIRRVQRFARDCPATVVTLRGNHEDAWIKCYEVEPQMGFLLPEGNGCLAMYRSFVTDEAQRRTGDASPDEMARLLDVRAWLPRDVFEWMKALAYWHEDDHAIYVHAGLEGEGHAWKHPRDASSRAPLLWMREPDFFANYRGKRVVFGHTPVSQLPVDHVGPIAKLFDDPRDVWTRGDLVGLDTGCGKGGFLSAIELPAMRVYESR